jgi:hypothetical protein
MRYVLAVLGAIIVGGTLAYACMALLDAREAGRQETCQHGMRGLQLALLNYKDSRGQFPPAHILGPDGKPWHSWRVLILPYMCLGSVVEEYRFDEPWNSPHNLRFAEKIPADLFQCPSGPDYGKTQNTNFVAVVGDQTVFPSSPSVAVHEIDDGDANTMLLVEIGKSDIHWMEPRDLDFSSIALELDPARSSSAAISSPHEAGPCVVFADGGAGVRLQPPIDLDALRAMLTRSGGEDLERHKSLR